MPTGDWSGRERRATLRSYGLTAGHESRALDEIVALAARLCRKPMAFASLIEEDRQWFIARHGIATCETPIEQSICATILDHPDVTVIEDTRNDPRTSGNPLCAADLGVGFYAGVPLRTETGRAIGALAVLDHAPGRMTDSERDLLAVLSRQVMAHLDLRRALRRASIMRREVDHRVKNSLQSVASLTSMQARAATQPEVREALQIVIRRIGTVAALNAELYRQDADNLVSLPTFLDSVVALIRESAPAGVKVGLDCAEISITSQRAGALAIIVNEFATNSFKHAFPEEQPGHVSFVCRPEAPGTASLACRDDGIGFPKDSASNGLGLAIIESAVDQLGGEQTPVDLEQGYGIRIVFGL